MSKEVGAGGRFDIFLDSGGFSNRHSPTYESVRDYLCFFFLRCRQPFKLGVYLSLIKKSFTLLNNKLDLRIGKAW